MNDDIQKFDENNVLESINLKIESYLDVKSDFINDDYLEVLGDSVNVVKAFTSISKLIKKKRLSYFLKGLSKENEPSFEQLCKLYDYIDDEEKAEIIADAISKVISANSKLASFLIGLLMNRLINSEERIEHEYLIYLNAMSSFFDNDIHNFVLLKEYFDTENVLVNDNFDFHNGFVNWSSKNGKNEFGSIELTVEKAVSSQILIKYIETQLHTDETDHRDMNVIQEETLSITNAGKILFDNLKYLDIL